MSEPVLKIGSPASDLRRNFELPLDAVTQKLAFLGRTGSGKTYASMKVAEQMLDAGAQIVVIDPVGVWWGLRLAKDGESPGYKIPVLGGLHGDVPLDPGSGAVVADLVADRRLSVVIDVSQFETDTAKARFAADFADRFFRRRKAAPAPVHLFLEECQEFVPQNTQRGEEKMLHYFNRIWKLGRNFGIGGSLISQRPQEVNKKALNMTGCLFAFQMSAPHERKVVRDWVSYQGGAEDVDALLPTLDVGVAHVDSPQWLGVAEVVHIAEKETFDASSTPEVGGAPVAVRELEAVDLEELRAQLEETIRQAEAEDPKALQRRIRELERELRAAQEAEPEGVAPEDVRALIDAAVKKAEQALVAAFEENVRSLMGSTRQYAEALVEIGDRLSELSIPIPLHGQRVVESKEAIAERVASGRARTFAPQPPAMPPSSSAPAAAVSSNGSSRSDLNPSETAVLDAIAYYHEIVGQPWVPRNKAAAFAGIPPSKSTLRNALSTLRKRELIEDGDGGSVRLTYDGWALADVPRVPPDPEDRLAQFSADLNPSEAGLLRYAFDRYPEAVTREDAAAAAGIDPSKSTLRNALSTLRSRGLIEDERGGSFAVSDVIFPGGPNGR